MCGKRFALICLALSLGLSSLWAQVSPSPATQAPSSTPTSEPPAGLWDLLHEQTQSLPMDFESFEASLKTQVGSLAISNKSLTQTNSDLKISNQDLQISNASLTTKNALLTESLKQSEAKAATSEAKSKQLQTDLDASTLSITQAQVHAKALELQVGFLKFGCWSFGVGLAAVGVYEAGTHDWTLGPIKFKKIW